MDGLFLKILNMSITGAIVILAVMLLRLALKRAPKWISYALWAVVLFRLVCPVSFASEYSFVGWASGAEKNAGGMTYISAENFFPEGTNAPAAPDMITPAISADVESDGTLQVTNTVMRPTVTVTKLPSTVLILGWVWLGGAFAAFSFGSVSYVRLLRRIGEATRITDGVLETDTIETPFVCGFFRPKIYLPLGLGGKTLDYVLLHERTHIRRGDHIVKPLAFAVLCVHWFNPLVWLAFRLMCRDMEMSCDERVLRGLEREEKADYGEALLRLAAPVPVFSGSPLAFGESDAKGRVKNVLHYKRTAFWLLLLVVLAVAAAALWLLADPKEEPKLGGDYHVTEILYDAPEFSFSYTIESAPIYEIDDGMNLVEDHGDSDQVFAALEKRRVTVSEFTAMFPEYTGKTLESGFNPERTAKAVRNFYYTKAAYGAGVDAGTFCLVMEMQNGEIQLAYGYERDGSPRVRWVFRLSTELQIPGVYVWAGTIHIPSFSSAFYPEGPGLAYFISENSFIIADEETLEERIGYTGVDLTPHTVDTDEWNALFFAGVGIVDISGYEIREYYVLSEEHRLYRFDNELLLAEIRSIKEGKEPVLWQLYRLRKTDFTWDDLNSRTGPTPASNTDAEVVKRSLTELPLPELLTQIRAEDILWVDLDAAAPEEIVPLLHAAAGHYAEPVPKEQAPYWDIALFLEEKEPGVYSYDDALELEADYLNENIVTITWQDETVYVESAELYQFVRHVMDTERIINTEALARYGTFVQAHIDTIMASVNTLMPEAGAGEPQLLSFFEVNTFEDIAGGTVHVWRLTVGVPVQHVDKVFWVGGMNMDGDLRLRGVSPQEHMAVLEVDGEVREVQMLFSDANWAEDSEYRRNDLAGLFADN